MTVIYMAHPVSGDVVANLARAKRWLGWLNRNAPDDVVFIAPWISHIEAVGGDGTQAEREKGLRGDCEVVARCDAIMLVGGRVSAGMEIEAAAAQEVRDLTYLGEEPPPLEEAA